MIALTGKMELSDEILEVVVGEPDSLSAVCL